MGKPEHGQKLKYIKEFFKVVACLFHRPFLLYLLLISLPPSPDKWTLQFAVNRRMEGLVSKIRTGQPCWCVTMSCNCRSEEGDKGDPWARAPCLDFWQMARDALHLDAFDPHPAPPPHKYMKSENPLNHLGAPFLPVWAPVPRLNLASGNSFDVGPKAKAARPETV